MCAGHAQVRLQPDEAIYMKIVVKKPGLEMESIVSELDLSYKQRYTGAYIPDAYERLILDAIRGDQQHFVRRRGPSVDCAVKCEKSLPFEGDGPSLIV
jgi:glucose-6-phosphate 1-dehydrogenase